MYKKHGNEIIEEEQMELDRKQKKILCLRAISDAYKSGNKDFIKQNMNTILKMMKDTNFSFNFLEIGFIMNSKDSVNESCEEYESIIGNYYNILCIYSEMAKYLNITNSLDLCIYFTYLLWNGYFSVTGEHTYEKSKEDSIYGLQALEVMNGTGVCYNYADLLNDFLYISNIKSSVIATKFPSKKEGYTIDYKPKIKKHVNKIKENEILKKFNNKIECKIGNHAVNLIKDGEKLYIYDVTNMALLKIKDKDYASIINGSGNFELKMLTSTLLFDNCDRFNLFEEVVLENEIDDYYTRKEYMNSCRKIVKLLNENENLLVDCYNHIYNDLETISITITENDKQKQK